MKNYLLAILLLKSVCSVSMDQGSELLAQYLQAKILALKLSAFLRPCDLALEALDSGKKNVAEYIGNKYLDENWQTCRIVRNRIIMNFVKADKDVSQMLNAHNVEANMMSDLQMMKRAVLDKEWEAARFIAQQEYKK